jgi:hypothetical protein
MLRSNLLLALGSVGLMAVIACGDDAGTGGSGGSGGAGAGTPGEGVQPPARPDGAGPGDGSAATIFGTTKLYLGVKTRAGVESTDAWKDFGYDLDQQVTTNDFANHCTPAGQGIPTNVFPDGNDGIDNSFGRTLLPVVKLAAMGTDLEAEVNSAIAEGSFNVMINIKDLGTGANYDPLDSILLAGKNGMGNTWEIVPEILSNPADPDSSTVTFPGSYLSDNVWVSGNKGTVDLTLSIAGFDLSLEIKSAFITMELSADRTTATNGVIAGVLDTEALVDTIASLAGSLSPDFCDPSSPTVASILNQVRQASDIMADGSQQAGTPCTGISIGLGFDAAAVTVSGVGMPAEPTPDPCDMAAGGAGGGM